MCCGEEWRVCALRRLLAEVEFELWEQRGERKLALLLQRRANRVGRVERHARTLPRYLIMVNNYVSVSSYLHT
jgi:hypothetical protein